MAISWLVVCGIGFVRYLELRYTDALKYEPEVGGEREKLDFVTRSLLCVCAFMAMLVAITAVLAPPSGIDGMVYHMPRVAMWISDHNVAFFPTANYTQLIYGAFAEYSMLHTMELWGSDRFVNFVQFFSFLGSAVAVSCIVKKMGGGAWSQALGGLICISIPEGVLEASGPMTTYSNAFWIASTVAFLLAWNEDPGWLNTVCIGLGAGLAIFTKGTTYVILPFLVLACWWVASRQSKILFLSGAWFSGVNLRNQRAAVPAQLRIYRQAAGAADGLWRGGFPYSGHRNSQHGSKYFSEHLVAHGNTF